MVIQTSTFLALVSALAAGAAGGYYASQKQVFAGPPLTADPSKNVAASVPSAIAAAASSSAPAIPAAPPPPVCDDTSGTPATCPPPGYSAEEGGCGALPTKRCGDFKQTMKPKVAERAVECLNALKFGERCDPMRLAVCGHLALMRACPEPETEAANAITTPGVVTTTCQTILEGCQGTALAPTMRDCRATLAGMSELGRTNMASCMKTHCSDKGLFGCEATIAAP